MKIVEQNSEPTASISLGPTQTIRNVAALHSQLGDALTTAREVLFDGGDLERVDTAFIQLLAAFVRQAESLGVAVDWRGKADELKRVARLLGMEAVINNTQKC